MKCFIVNHLILTAALSIIMFGCNEQSFDPTFKIEKNKITCTNCYDFGKIIVTDKDHVLISGYETIWIIKYDGQNMELIQTISIDYQTSGIQSMVINNSTLAFGVADADGTGKVFIYERFADLWELKQEIRIGRISDNFGSDIDIAGDYMVIGASAPWSNPYPDNTNPREGRVYIFRKTSEGWIQEHEFLSEKSTPDDRFGESVAIHDGFALAGGGKAPFHIYKYNGTWELVRTDTIPARTISHSGNNFMTMGDYQLYAFTLESDGGFNYNSVKLDFDVVDISDHGEIIELKNDLALIAMESSYQCYLLNYANNQWTNIMVFEPDNGESVYFSGMAITDTHVIIGGRNSSSSNPTGYVYFRNY